MNKTQIAPFNEIIACVILQNLDNDNFHAFAKNPRAFIFTHINCDIGDSMKLHTVENNADEVHLALPYYSEMAELNAKILTDCQLNEITGGEIVIGLAIAGGYALATSIGFGLTASTAIGFASGLTVGVTLATVAVGTAAVVLNDRGKTLLGKEK